MESQPVGWPIDLGASDAAHLIAAARFLHGALPRVPAGMQVVGSAVWVEAHLTPRPTVTRAV